LTHAAESKRDDSGSAQDHPPKPVLTLRVGISGHRPKKERFLPGEFRRVQDQLHEVFEAIERVLEELKARNKYYQSDDHGRLTPHRIRLVSGLAEGADQIAVAAKPHGWDLDAVLPFPEEEYLTDFQNSAKEGGGDVTQDFIAAKRKATTILQLPRDPRLPRQEPTDARANKEYWRIRNLAYARLGRFLLGQIDVLVAVWDGKREDGPGGTAEVVRGALDAGIPVVWISTLERFDPRMISDVDDDARPIASTVNALNGSLKEAIAPIISVPYAAPEPKHGKQHRSVEGRLDEFLNETWPTPTRSVTYDLFKRFMEGSRLRWVIKPDALEQAKSYMRSFIDATPQAAGSLRARIEDTLLTRYVWADSLAVERSNWYRSAYINCFLLAALLVFIALLGVFVHGYFHSDAAVLAAKACLVLAELALVARIIYIVRLGRRRRWQEKWVEYRALAEMLRSVISLSYIGEHGYIQRRRDLEPASSGWFLWYLRATIREIGLPSARLDDTYQNELLLAVEKHVLDDQIAWNRKTSATLSKMHHLLHVTGDFCFQLTVVVLLVYLALYAYYLGHGYLAGISLPELFGLRPHPGVVDPSAHGTPPGTSTPSTFGHVLAELTNYVTFLAALLPAAGAAVLGIRETGDFDGFAKRAARTAEKLDEVKQDVAAAREKPLMDTTTSVLLATAQILSEDVGAWQSIYGRKRLNLPG
jgi:hypothetical protein